MDDERVAYFRWTEAEILQHAGRPYDQLLTRDEEMVMDRVVDFFHEHMKHKTSNKERHLKKIVREMADSTSELRIFLHDKNHHTFNRPMNMNMNLIALREVFKAFEQHSQDKGNGWYSSTPLNIVMFYQLFELTGQKAWHEKHREDSSQKRRSTEESSKKRRSETEDSSVVYLITNPNEVNAFGHFKKYVGRTKCMRRRLKQHLSPYSGCRLLKNAILKYGFYGGSTSHPMHYEILVAGTSEDMKYCETTYIDQYNTLAPHGYNMKVGDTVDFPANALVQRSTGLRFSFLSTPIQIKATSMVLNTINEILTEESTDTGLVLETNVKL
jgi:hypothetical protein